MVPKAYRLDRELSSYLQASRRYFHTEHFILRVAEGPEGPRIGVSVSKKVAKQANQRNRTRRRAYAVIQELLPTLQKQLYLLVAKAGAERMKSDELKIELAELLKKG